MKPSQDCLNFLREHEGCELKAYQDGTGIWTIGYGSTTYETGKSIQPGDTITKDKADSLLVTRVNTASYRLAKMIVNRQPNETFTLTGNQYDAILALAYNIGEPSFAGSTVFKRILMNPNDETSIREAWLMWNKIHKFGRLVELPGLTKRREAELQLYFKHIV